MGFCASIAKPAAEGQTHETRATLNPGQAAEIKLDMRKGRQVERDAGEIEAAFDGMHGFYWRNRSGGNVTVTLKTEGEYSALKRVL